MNNVEDLLVSICGSQKWAIAIDLRSTYELPMELYDEQPKFQFG